MCKCVRLVQRDVRRLNRYLPSSGRQGVAGVDDQVGNHLLNLAGVGADHAEDRRKAQSQVNILADQPAEHFVQVVHDRVEQQNPRRQHLLAD